MSPWAVICTIFVIFIFSRRLVADLYRDGKIDQTGRHIVKVAGIIPVSVTIALLLLEVFLLSRFQGRFQWLPWVIGTTALAGSIWSIERGRTALRVFRNTHQQ